MMRDRRSLLLLMALLAGCSGAAGSNDPGAMPATLVKTLPVETATEIRERRFSGYLHPWEAHGVGFLVPGRVTSIRVKEGDRVRKGQLLATLDPEDYALVQRLAEIQVEALAPNVERVSGLVDERVLPAAQLDELKGKYDAALTQRQQAGRQVAYTRLNAPCSGVIMERKTAVGQVIGAGMPAVILLDVSRVKLKLGVTQQELGLFHEGDEVTLEVPGLSGTRQGTVHHIALVPDQLTHTYAVAVELDNAAVDLRPGMLAHLALTTESVSGLFVPLPAVKRNADHHHVVYLVDDQTKKVLERPVTVGALFGERIEIREGLTAGEAVIVEGQGFVAPGDPVRVK